MMIPIAENRNYFDVVHTYTQRDAIEDGYLVDVTKTAREAGFVWPVAVTIALWNQIEPSENDSGLGQSIEGRLWDLVYMGSRAISSKKPISDSGRIGVEMIVLRFDEKTKKSKRTLLRYDVCMTFTDNGKPAITICLPGED